MGLPKGPRSIPRRYVDRPHRFDGCLPRSRQDEPFGDRFPVFEDIHPVPPKNEWQDAYDQLMETGGGLLQYNLWINNQAPESSCVSNATETAIHTKGCQQFGKKLAIKCSPMSLYKRVCSSRHSGSTCQGNLEEVAARGILPEDTPENRLIFKHVFPQNTWAVQLPDGWEETAILFQVDQWADIGSVEGMIWATHCGYPLVYGRSGHSICGLLGVPDKYDWLLMYAQSYGVKTGDHGYQYDSLSYLDRARARYGAWACLGTSYYLHHLPKEN